MTDATEAPKLPEKVLEFTIGEDHYCVDIDTVDEIVRSGNITTLPDTPPRVEGVMNLRSETTTILDPRVVFGMDDADEDDQSVIIFDGGSDERIGWLVTRVIRVADLPDPELGTVSENQYLAGVIRDGEAFVLWVDSLRVNRSVSTAALDAGPTEPEPDPA